MTKSFFGYPVETHSKRRTSIPGGAREAHMEGSPERCEGASKKKQHKESHHLHFWEKFPFFDGIDLQDSFGDFQKSSKKLNVYIYNTSVYGHIYIYIYILV